MWRSTSGRRPTLHTNEDEPPQNPIRLILRRTPVTRESAPAMSVRL